MGNRWTCFPPRERFLSNFEKSEGCWEWAGLCSKDGYGKFFYEGRYQGAHRVSYKFEHGDIPAGLCVLHRCDNPLCIRPAHLFVGTKADNCHDMRGKGRGWWQKPGFVSPRTIACRASDKPRSKSHQQGA